MNPENTIQFPCITRFTVLQASDEIPTKEMNCKVLLEMKDKQLRSYYLIFKEVFIFLKIKKCILPRRY